jgi:hypothetical protein
MTFATDARQLSDIFQMAKQKSPAEFLHIYLHISGYLKNRGNAGTRIVSVDIVTRLQAE